MAFTTDIWCFTFWQKELIINLSWISQHLLDYPHGNLQQSIWQWSPSSDLIEACKHHHVENSQGVLLSSLILFCNHCFQAIKQDRIVLERSARLNLDPGRGDLSDGGDKWSDRQTDMALRGDEGDGGDEGIPWGHRVGLMSLFMIHKAYMPVYKWSRFLVHSGRDGMGTNRR